MFDKEPDISTLLVVAPLHKTWFGGCTTDGDGFTVIVKVLDGPGQPPVDGVTVMLAVIETVLVLTGIIEGILPVPLAGNPIAVLSFVQLYIVPLKVDVKFTGLEAMLLQKPWFGG